MADRTVIYECEKEELKPKQKKFVLKKVEEVKSVFYDGGDRYYLLTFGAEGEPEHKLSVEYRIGGKFKNNIGVWLDDERLKEEQ